ncbi:hypothetical protein GCM10009847_05030 [Leucobacter tardus]|uniref:Tautomerase family protein n=1 Tax=Leucobacter tardus TaxID=501483 RepID=A0A939TLS1_9MICO|nr:tautomerase family protein [Leucobacter tardus]MBO2988708.1 tautomerase family protein [Leucobacter tardus]
MPIARITLNKGKSPEYLEKVSQSIYSAMRESYNLDENDKFHIFQELDANTFKFDRNFGVPQPRTDDFMIIDILSDPRQAPVKLATMRALKEKLVESVGLAAQDVVVTFDARLAAEDASLGYGEPVLKVLQ